MTADEVRQRGVSVVTIDFEVDLATVGVLKTELERTTADTIVDLGPCTFMDLSGLRVLLFRRRRLEKLGCRLVIVCVPDGPAATVMRMARVGRLLEVFDDLQSAKAAFGIA